VNVDGRRQQRNQDKEEKRMKKAIKLTLAVALLILLCGLAGAGPIAADRAAQEVLGSISGTVYEADGITPIPNIAVDIEGGGHSTCTDPDGAYTLSGLVVSEPEWPQGYNVVAGAYDCDPGHLFAQETSWDIEPTEHGPDVVGNDFMLEQAGTISSLSGTVWEMEGVTPIADMGISVGLPTGDEVRTCTDENGHYHLSGLPPGRSRVRAYHHDCSDHTYLRAGKSVRVEESGNRVNATANFWLELGGSISGTVYEADGFTPAVHVPVDIEQGGYVSCTDENGWYELRTLELGTYNVVAGRGVCEYLGYGPHPYAQDTLFGVSVTDTQPKATGVDFALDPGGFIVGTVRDTSGHPIPNIGIGTEGGGYGVCTDGSGHYALGGLPLGTYDVVGGLDLCGPYCFTPQTVEGVEVAAGDPYTIDFALDPGDPGATLYVDGSPGGDTGTCQDAHSPCETIGYALSQAENCDAILVADGTYLENLEIADKTIMLRGGYTISGGEQWLPGTGETIVDGGNVDRTIFIHGSNSVLENLTITGGYAEEECWAAGVYVTDGFVTIRSSIIKNNWAGCGGGGIGVNADWGEAILILEDSLVKDNYAGNSGGGIALEAFYAALANTVIVNNSAGESGAGLETSGYAVDLTNVVISNNNSPVASALHIGDGDVTVQNCTITGNDPPAEEAILLAAPHPATLTVRNSILWDNGVNIRIGEGPNYDRRIVDASYCDTEGGGWPGTGNIDADPLFFDPASGDYQLSLSSPCIDAGTDMNAPDYDLEHRPRPVDGNGDGAAITDMGAYEFPRVCERREGIDDLRGRWTFVVTGLEEEPLSYEVYINDLGPDPNTTTGNDYLAVGCMASPGVDAMTPMFMRTTDLCDGAHEINLLSTAVPPEGDPFVIQFLGTVEANGTGVSDDVLGGTIRTDWFQGGEWSGTHYDRRRTKCPPVGETPVPGLYFFADVWAFRDNQEDYVARRTAHIGGFTNIVSAGMQVEEPDGTIVIVPYYTDIMTPDVDFISRFRYLRRYEGDPVSGQPYTFTLVDVFGNQIPGTTQTDVWTACVVDPPRNLVAEVTLPWDVDLSWDSVPVAPGFDPDSDVGSYQIGIHPWRFESESQYGAAGILIPNHLIPWAGFGGWAEGSPDGSDFGDALGELDNGDYRLWVAANSEPAPGNPGYGHECTVLDLAEQLYLAKGDDAITFFTLGSISGTLRDEEGSPIVNVGVHVKPGYYDVCTDENGHYEVSGIPLGSYRVSAGRNFCDPHPYVMAGQTVDLTEEAPNATEVDFVLGLAGTVAGTVYDSAGLPLGNVVVDIEAGDWYVCTNEDGTYVLTQLPLGAYRIVAGGVSEWCEEQGFAQQISEEYLLTEEHRHVTEVDFWLDPVP
jgi:hypothetical protein